MRRLLRHLHRSGSLVIDPTARLTFDLAAIEKVEVTDNVVELLLRALRQLPAQTQHLATIAACLGRRRRSTSSPPSPGCHPRRPPPALWPAVREGLLVAEIPDGPLTVTFVHERVLQAAHAHLGEAERKGVHLRIAQLLLDQRSRPDERRDAVRGRNHLGAAAELVASPEDRHGLAAIDLRAGLRAKAAAAYDAAQASLERGIGLLPPDAWRSNPELAFRLHREAVECAHAAGDRTRAQRIFTVAFERAPSPLEKAELCRVQAMGCLGNLAAGAAVEAALRGLRLLGVDEPQGDDEKGGRRGAVGGQGHPAADRALGRRPPRRPR